MPSNGQQPVRRSWLLLVCILVVYAASVGRAVRYELVWDDIPEILNNPAFDRPLHEGLALTQVERGAADLAKLDTLQFTYDSYRPVTFSSYWLDIAMWGRSPRALHATSVILGALAIVLVFLVAGRWLEPRLAWLPAAFFALHPAQIETVAYVSARGDLLAGLFALGATYAVLRGVDAATSRRAIGWGTLAVVLFAASLLAKESYLALPIALGVITWARADRRRWWWTPVAMAVIAIAYVPFRAAMIDVRESTPILDAIGTLPAFLAQAVHIVVLPFDLSIERPFHAGLLAGALLLAGVAALLAWRLTRGDDTSRRRAWLALSAVSWFVVLLGPSAIVVARTHTLADRYLYAPLLGLAILLTLGIAAVLESERLGVVVQRALIGVALVWAAIILVVGWRQVPVWRDPAALYAHALAMEPASSRANYRVAVLEIAADRWNVAVPLLERAIELDPRNAMALNNLGVYYLRSGRHDAAEATLRRAIDANPAHFRAWTNLGLAQSAAGNRRLACQSIARALVINPGYVPAQNARAQVCP